MPNNNFEKLIESLTNLPTETEWVEFKRNFDDPNKIGENISALANSAALLGKKSSYIVWGIDDSSHKVVGTSFLPKKKKVGNEEMESWLLQRLNPRLNLKIIETEINNKPIVIFEIPAANNRPISFANINYIRVGSYTKKLNDYPEKERELWRLFDKFQFESGIAKKDVSSDEVLSIIDYPSYFTLLKQPLPDNRAAILEKLSAEKIIISIANDSYNITNLGAILFAKELSIFDHLSRKALRVITYRDSNRINTIHENLINKGYAISFEDTIEYIDNQLPQNEEIGVAFRKEIRMYPKIAIRELVANALIHQDFSVTGPTVEIFSDRMEITNPGIPLIDTLRFIDEPPKSRNEALASLMRRMAVCEERGSGIDKVIFNIELFQLPAPDFRASTDSTIVVLYGPRNFSQMSREERIRACYQHACLQYVSNKQMTNSTLRSRLNIKESNYPIASKIIRDTVEAKLIKSKTEKSAKRDAKYVPFWA